MKLGLKSSWKYPVALSALACLAAWGGSAHAQARLPADAIVTGAPPAINAMHQEGQPTLLLARHDDRHGRGPGARPDKHRGGPPHHRGPPPHAQRKGPPPHAHHARPPGPPPGWYKPPHRHVAPPPRVRWSRGDILPPRYRHSRYVVHDWHAHRYAPPPRGYQWMRIDGELLLVGIATGMVLQSIISR